MKFLNLAFLFFQPLLITPLFFNVSIWGGGGGKALSMEKESLNNNLELNVFQEFVQTGKSRNKLFQWAIHKTGWSKDEIKLAITKIYKFDSDSLKRFLYSEEGIFFMKKLSKPYFHQSFEEHVFLDEIRSAILKDSSDGLVSTIGITSNLSDEFLLIKECDKSISPGPCRPSNCKDSNECLTTLSWYLFLPACLQARYLGLQASSESYQRYCYANY